MLPLAWHRLTPGNSAGHSQLPLACLKDQMSVWRVQPPGGLSCRRELLFTSAGHGLKFLLPDFIRAQVGAEGEGALEMECEIR